MKTRKIFQFAMICVLGFLLFISMATIASAQGPWPWNQVFPWPTATPWPAAHPLSVGERFTLGWAVFPATPIPVPIPASRPPVNLAAPPIVPAPIVSPGDTARNGDRPMNALTADGARRSLAAGASAWYKVGNGGEHIVVSLDANVISGMSLLVYAPGNLSDPIGQGTLENSTTRLVWAGGHWNSGGDWLARVSNNNPMVVQYTLTSSANKISNKSCHSYWENYPTGQQVYWTECER